MIFSDRFERDHVLELYEDCLALLADDLVLPEGRTLSDLIADPITETRRRIAIVEDALKCSERNCDECGVLAELDYLLSSCLEWPEDFRRDWPRIHDLLIDADRIGMEAQLNAELAAIEPLAKTGRKVKEGAARGHTTAHGTEENKQERWRTYQEFLDKKRAEHPGLLPSHYVRLAADHFRVSTKTITRHAK